MLSRVAARVCCAPFTLLLDEPLLLDPPLLELPLDETLLGAPDRLQNAVAYQCFGIDHLADFATDPFATSTEPQTLLDQIRGTDLTDCDVPLAILYWTATEGVQFVDMWAVRRVIRDAEKKNLKISAFVQGVATSPLFTMGKVAEPSSTTAVAPGEKR